MQHIQKKGEDHHDDDPSAKADHGLDGPPRRAIAAINTRSTHNISRSFLTAAGERRLLLL